MTDWGGGCVGWVVLLAGEFGIVGGSMGSCKVHGWHFKLVVVLDHLCLCALPGVFQAEVLICVSRDFQ